MNASIQFLKSVPEIDKMIKNIKPNQNNPLPSFLAAMVKKVDMSDVQPIEFVQFFLALHP